MLSKALLNGELSIKVSKLTDFEKQELEDCGYTVKKVGKEYIISH